MELLAPVGDKEMLIAAVEAGCDSVYFGVKEFNMRANAKSFELTELASIVDYCHSKNVKAYLTLNTIIFDNELNKVKKILKIAKSVGIDAIICWDHSVIKLCNELSLDVHLSTQASVANFESLKFYASLGVKRIVLARELSLKQIQAISKKIKSEKLDIEIETFAHGAMCVAVSGRCFTSQFLFCKSANRGDCLQPCRRAYKVTDLETGDELKIENNYVMSAKDLCTLPFLDKLKQAGISAFKIEGRMRSPEYVKTVVSIYKEVLNNGYKEELLDKLKTVYNRKFSSGFYFGLPTADDFTDLYGSNATTKKVFVGYVKNYFKNVNVAEIKIESSELNIGDKLMIIGPTTGVKEQIIKSMEINNQQVNKVKKSKNVGVKLEFIARINDKVFVIKNN